MGWTGGANGADFESDRSPPIPSQGLGTRQKPDTPPASLQVRRCGSPRSPLCQRRAELMNHTAATLMPWLSPRRRERVLHPPVLQHGRCTEPPPPPMQQGSPLPTPPGHHPCPPAGQKVLKAHPSGPNPGSPSASGGPAGTLLSALVSRCLNRVGSQEAEAMGCPTATSTFTEHRK